MLPEQGIWHPSGSIWIQLQTQGPDSISMLPEACVTQGSVLLVTKDALISLSRLTGSQMTGPSLLIANT